MSQKYFSALFKGMLTLNIFREPGHRENMRWKKYIIVCFMFNAMSIGLVEIACKIFEGKLYG